MSRQLEDLLVRTLKEASSLFEKENYKIALEKLDKAEKLAENAKRLDLLCRVLLQKGAVLASMDKPDESQSLYDKALGIFRTSDLNEEESTVLQSTLSNTFSELAEHFKKRDGLENAEKCYMNVIKVYEILLENYPEDTEPELEIAHIFDDIGNLYESFEQQDLEPETVKLYCEKALNAREKAFELVPESDRYRHHLAWTLRKLANLYVMQQDYETAIQLQERVIEVLEEVPEILANWQDLKATGNAYDMLGTLYAEIGEKKLEAKQYTKAIEYYELIFDDEWPLSVKMMLATEVMERGKTLLLSKKHDSAKESMDLVLGFLEGVDEEELKDSGYQAKLAKISEEYAKILSDMDMNDELEEFTGKLKEIFGKLAKEDSGKQDIDK